MAGAGAGGGEPPEVRGPQSVQSVPRAQSTNSEPGPPSSHIPSDEKLQVSVHRGEVRGPQSVQSVLYSQEADSAPKPPSLQTPSDAELQVLRHST